MAPCRAQAGPSGVARLRNNDGPVALLGLVPAQKMPIADELDENGLFGDGVLHLLKGGGKCPAGLPVAGKSPGQFGLDLPDLSRQLPFLGCALLQGLRGSVLRGRLKQLGKAQPGGTELGAQFTGLEIGGRRHQERIFQERVQHNSLVVQHRRRQWPGAAQRGQE